MLLKNFGPSKIKKTSDLGTARVKLAKIGAIVVSQGRYAPFQLAEVAVPEDLPPNSTIWVRSSWESS